MQRNMLHLIPLFRNDRTQITCNINANWKRDMFIISIVISNKCTDRIVRWNIQHSLRIKFDIALGVRVHFIIFSYIGLTFIYSSNVLNNHERNNFIRNNYSKMPLPSCNERAMSNKRTLSHVSIDTMRARIATQNRDRTHFMHKLPIDKLPH